MTTTSDIDQYSFLLKPSLREVFNATVKDCNITVAHLAKRCGVPASSISRFQTGDRELTTQVLQKILNGFTVEEYRYFLGLQAKTIDYLAQTDPALQDVDHCNDTKLQYATFRVMVMNFAVNCDDWEQFEDLLCLLMEGRRRRKRDQRNQPRDQQIASEAELNGSGST